VRTGVFASTTKRKVFLCRPVCARAMREAHMSGYQAYYEQLDPGCPPGPIEWSALIDPA